MSRWLLCCALALSAPALAHPDPDEADGGVDLGDAGPQVLTTVIRAPRPLSAASSFAVRDRDFALRPIASVQDVLRVTPGLVMVQHSGGGKANQYFLRGFDADHGTDVALSIDGVPINLVSHAHGQGFADTNFIIPEVVEKVEVTKGPYFADLGDFDTAGAVNLVSRESFEHSSVSLGIGGAPGHGGVGGRALVIASPGFDGVGATFAAEVGRTDGPFQNPEAWNRFKLFNRLTLHPSERSTLSLVEMSYGANWNGSGQLPARAIEQGLVTRFGALDPSEGGATGRHQLALAYVLRPDEHSELKALVYGALYRFNLDSNFTLFLNDPVNGDELEQVDRRVFLGAKVSYRHTATLGGVRFDTTVGGDLRNDDIHAELWHAAQRERLEVLRSNDVHELLGGLFLNEEISPWPWLRFDAGGRLDVITFAVDDTLPAPVAGAPRSGSSGAFQLSPKASLIVTPLEREQAQLELYLNFGHGFHSNDVRGAFSAPRVSPLARAIGEEVGVRSRLFGRWDFAAALWKLDLGTETVWSGDEGTTEVSGPTNRYGVELETRFELTDWLAADLEVTFTHSQFSTDGANGGGLALAPRQTWSGGLSGRHPAGPGLLRGGVRFFGIGDRPATDDGALVAPGFTQFDLHLGYRHRRFDLALDIENLFNGAFRSAQFATVSRLAGEPAIGATVPAGFSCGRGGRLAPSTDGSFQGCEDVASTPAAPFTVRATVTVFLD
ncbi:MAG: TonB-dependent receptor [Myxococcaceae bacterium]|nr:TonB-dependent receptor [Myxococcaceae bacterium]